MISLKWKSGFNGFPPPTATHHKIWPLTSFCKVLLDHSNAHVWMFSLFILRIVYDYLCITMAESRSCNKDHMFPEPEIFACWPLQENFGDIWPLKNRIEMPQWVYSAFHELALIYLSALIFLYLFFIICAPSSIDSSPWKTVLFPTPGPLPMICPLTGHPSHVSLPDELILQDSAHVLPASGAFFDSLAWLGVFVLLQTPHVSVP